MTIIELQAFRYLPCGNWLGSSRQFHNRIDRQADKCRKLLRGTIMSSFKLFTLTIRAILNKAFWNFTAACNISTNTSTWKHKIVLCLNMLSGVLSLFYKERRTCHIKIACPPDNKQKSWVFLNTNYIWWRVQIIKFFSTLTSPPHPKSQL